MHIHAKYDYHGITLYAIGDKLYTKEEIERMEQEVAKKDEEQGYNDRMSHYYDKWYRYNREDDGEAYDRGARRASNEKHTEKWYREDEQSFRVIPA